MGLEPIAMKSKRTSTIGCGTHLCTILDMYYLTNGAKQYILADQKHKIMVVLFAADWKKGQEKKIHEQHYVIDGSFKQGQFKQMLTTSQVTSSVEGASPTKKDAIGKRLWLSIKEVHTIDDDKPVIENDEPLIDRFVFAMSPYIDNGKKPKIPGDPADNDGGIPSGEFVEWRNIAVKKAEPVIEKPVQKPITQSPVDLDDVPQF
jgi:hypothetical protein